MNSLYLHGQPPHIFLNHTIMAENCIKFGNFLLENWKHIKTPFVKCKKFVIRKIKERKEY